MEHEKEIQLQDALEYLKDSGKQFKRNLKSHSFDFDSVDEKGKNLLIHIIETLSSTDHLWVLLDYFADPNIKDLDYGMTALHYACKLNKKDMAMALLLFGAKDDLTDNDGKTPFELYPNKDNMTTIVESINLIKPQFIQLTRKRRKNLKYIFEEMEQGSKLIDDSKLASLYQTINNESEDEALKDAQLFISLAKLYRNDYESKPTITFEEFIIAMAKIVQLHGMKVIDQFIEKFKASYKKKEE
jgi:ankyrin repeat protein